jgi:hypothetical protein
MGEVIRDGRVDAQKPRSFAKTVSCQPNEAAIIDPRRRRRVHHRV